MWKHSAILSGCLFVISACGESGGVPANVQMPMNPTAGMAAGGVNGSSSGTGASGSTGTAGSTIASGGSGGKASGGAGGTGGGGGGPAPVTAIAHIMPLASASTGSAGSGGSSAAGSSGSAGGSAAGGGITGTALFTKVNIGVQLKVDIDGCMDGKTYPVHIHEGMSCDNAMTQGGHWGAVTAAAGSGGSSAGGSGGSSAGAGGHSAGAGGSGGAAAGGPAPMMVRGEGIPDIVCKGTMGSTALTRTTPDVRIVWSIGGDPMTDVVGHVIVVHNANGDRIACGKIMMQ